MKFFRVGFGRQGAGSSSSSPLLVMLFWCTSLTIATAVTNRNANANPNTLRPSRTVLNKRSSDSMPVFIEDQCASFKSDLGDELKKILNLSWMETSKDVEMCLCNSTIANFVSSSGNKQIEIAKAYVGSDKVSQALQTLVARNSPQGCGPLPSNAKRVCNSDGARSDLCDFTCQSPFRKSNNSCLLPASPSAKVKKRSLAEEVVMMQSSTCLPNEQVCARDGTHDSFGFSHPQRSSNTRSSSLKLAGNSNSRFECVDVQKDLFNCGGCAAGMIGLMGEREGVDCSDLPGVDDVECVFGRCKVTRCGWGWKLNPRGNGCVRLMK